MTDLQRRALARTPLTEDEVAALYDYFAPHRRASAWQDREARAVRDLCASHERLRAELAGVQSLLADAERRVAELEGRQ